MRTDPLHDDIEAGRTSVGIWAQSPDIVELCAFVGFRWVMLDQMFSPNDWSTTDQLLRAAEAAGITPVVRVQSNPWLGYDHRIAVDVARATGIGAQYVLVSHSEQREIDECIVASRDWHRRALTMHPYRDRDELMPSLLDRRAPTCVIPQPETQAALDTLEDLIRHPEISMVFIGMSDAARALTGEDPPNFDHPKLWEYVDRAVDLGRRHGVTVGANTSYAYSIPELGKRVERLHEHGVRMVMVQGASFIFQVAANQLMSGLAAVLT
jgi:4-hydroxy-2-oxoheptanedioate aldolase